MQTTTPISTAASAFKKATVDILLLQLAAILGVFVPFLLRKYQRDGNELRRAFLGVLLGLVFAAAATLSGDIFLALTTDLDQTSGTTATLTALCEGLGSHANGSLVPVIALLLGLLLLQKARAWSRQDHAPLRIGIWLSLAVEIVIAAATHFNEGGLGWYKTLVSFGRVSEAWTCLEVAALVSLEAELVDRWMPAHEQDLIRVYYLFSKILFGREVALLAYKMLTSELYACTGGNVVLTLDLLMNTALWGLIVLLAWVGIWHVPIL